MNNTLVAENVATAGRDIAQSAVSGSHNLIGDGSIQSLVHGEDGNQVGTLTSPIDPRLSDWTELDNGRWGYYLLPGSPALDAGENGLAVDTAGQPLMEDIAGNPRIQNRTVDIGSVEGATAGSPGQTYVVASLDRTVAEDGVLTFLEAFEAANRNQPVGDAPAGSFTEADVIRFADGLNGAILVDDGELAIHGDLSIEGPGASLLGFDAGGTSRVLLIEPGVSARLSGLAITGGSAKCGAGIYNYYGTLTVANSTLSGNSARLYGGGIYNYYGTLAVTNSTLSGNSADSGGGGICSYSGTATVINSTLSGNAATGSRADGGGIYSRLGTVTVTNSTLSGNSATGSSAEGGGISNNLGTVTLTDSMISENSADHGGGGISNLGTVTVTNSVLLGNSARYGGGISNGGTLAVTNSTLSRNSADGCGGGISNVGTLTIANSSLSGNSVKGGYARGGGIDSSGTLTVINCTLSGNSADLYGGGIVLIGSSSTATLNNTVVAGNAASSEPDIRLFSGTLSGSNNLIGDGSGQSTLVQGESGNQVGTSTSPIDPRFSGWSELNNGRWGYYPLPGSPVLDAGANVLAVDAEGRPLVEDISGGPRIQNATVDIGAVEGAVVGSPAQVYVVTSLDRTIAEDGVLTFLEAFKAANRNQPVGDAPAGSFTETDVIRFAGGVSGTVPVEDGELIIHGDLSIEGPGAALLTFDAKGTSRVFLVNPGVSADLSGMTITGGSADDGGGIRNLGTLTLTNSTLSGNSAKGDQAGGGGIYNLSGTLTLTNSTLSGNWARGDQISGGGVYNHCGTVTVVNSTFSGNSTSYYGGAIHSNDGTLTLTNSTLSGNSAHSRGGGIYSSGSLSMAALNNTVVAGNLAPTGPDVYHDAGTLSGSHNLIGDGTGQSSLVQGEDGNQIGTSTSPIDPFLSDWSELGNGRWGHYPLPGSPALDMGENTLAVDAAGQPLVEDISDNSRIQNGRVDIGAVEGTVTAGSAQVYMVTSLDRTVAEDGVLTFLEAFEAANRNQPVGDAPAGSFIETDVIRFAEGLSGTVLLEDGELAIYGDVNIEGRGAAVLTFDAQGASRLFLIEPGVHAALSGMTITGGSADDGGGIYNNHGTLTITNSTLSANSATGYRGSGGGIYSDRGELAVTNSTLLGNSATGYYGSGGGIYSDYDGTTTVTDSTLSGNSANDDGGGIYSNRGSLTVTNSTLSKNSATGRYGSGGGVYSSSGSLTVTNSTLSKNSATYGGGIYNSSGSLMLTSSTLTGNLANGGGGIANSGTLTVSNSTLSGNSAYRGGAIDNPGTATVTNSTFSGNSADSGGGICSSGRYSTATLNNTIVAGNTASSGPDIFHDSGTLSGSNNLIANGIGQSSLVHGENGNLVGTSEAPIDPRFIRNPSDGGDGWGDDPSTPDIDESANDDYGDLRLRPDSPAVDAGDDSLLPADEFDLDGDGDTTEPIPFDLAGNPRVLAARVDIGAYEYDPTPPIPGDLDADGRVNSADLDIIRAHWGESVTPGSLFDGDPSGDGVVNSDDLNIVRANWGQTAVAAGVPTAESDAEPSVENSVYGPVLPNEAATAEEHNRDTFFATRRELAEAAWMDAVERLKTRREVRETRAVDVVLLEWDGR